MTDTKDPNEPDKPDSGEKSATTAPTPAPNVLPIHPGMPIGGPRLDPVTELFQSMGMSFEHLTHERDSPKGRAWDLLCASARRAPVDEESVRHALKLSLFFEEEWQRQEQIRADSERVDAAESGKDRRS